MEFLKKTFRGEKKSLDEKLLGLLSNEVKKIILSYLPKCRECECIGRLYIEDLCEQCYIDNQTIINVTEYIIYCNIDKLLLHLSDRVLEKKFSDIVHLVFKKTSYYQNHSVRRKFLNGLFGHLDDIGVDYHDRLYSNIYKCISYTYPSSRYDCRHRCLEDIIFFLKESNYDPILIYCLEYGYTILDIPYSIECLAELYTTYPSKIRNIIKMFFKERIVLSILNNDTEDFLYMSQQMNSFGTNISEAYMDQGDVLHFAFRNSSEMFGYILENHRLEQIFINTLRRKITPVELIEKNVALDVVEKYMTANDAYWFVDWELVNRAKFMALNLQRLDIAQYLQRKMDSYLIVP